MVRMSDILKKAKDKKGFKFSSEVAPSKRKKRPPGKDKASLTPKHKAMPVKDSILRISPVMQASKTPTAKEILKLYQETFLLINDLLKNNKPAAGRKIVLGIGSLVDRLAAGHEELLVLALSATGQESQDYLYYHMVNVTVISLIIGLELGYDKNKLLDLGISALLYDIGMVNYRDIYQQPKQLSIEEYNQIKNHAREGSGILAKIEGLPKVALEVADQHHERIDGFGYPDGKKADQIEEYAGLIGFTDVYEALTHQRSYRQPYTPFEAIKIILKDKNSFDLKVVKSFLRKIGLYPVGSVVLLNTKEVAKVIRHNPAQSLAPKVLVIADSQGREAEGVREVDLSTNHAVQIIKCLGPY